MCTSRSQEISPVDLKSLFFPDKSSASIHDNLYQFWRRSEGIWFSKLVNVTIRLLPQTELLAISQRHLLEQPEFGVRMSWEYNTKPQSGQMIWCVDTAYPGLLFADRSMLDNSPQIFDYQMTGDQHLVITADKYCETFLLDGNHRRLRELRVEGKLIRRLWEHKFGD
jgi:hypothetical protein